MVYKLIIEYFLRKVNGFILKLWKGVVMVEKINQLCKQKSLTIASLEKELGYGNGTIRKWDKSQPSINKVLNVANRLEVPIDYLINEEDIPTKDINDLMSSIRNFNSIQLGLIRCYISLIESGKVG